MTWLLWKEYRQNRLIAYTALFLVAVPYVVGLYVLWKWGIRVLAGHPQWKACLVGSGIYSIGLSQLAVALIGGNSIAGERIDRSAEFQAYLPIPRRKILAAKLLLALLIVASIWLPNGLILWGTCDELIPRGGRIDLGVVEMFGNIAIVGLTMFCVAWFVSSFVNSPTFAVCAGLVAPLTVVGGILFVTYLREIPEQPLLEILFPAICVTLSATCFVIGTWLYLRRVEP
jgi:ABC-type transport system involved in multi-copper enzyme maturation permease subunit